MVVVDKLIYFINMKLNPDEQILFDEKQLYACKVWGLETNIGFLNSFTKIKQYS